MKRAVQSRRYCRVPALAHVAGLLQARCAGAGGDVPGLGHACSPSLSLVLRPCWHALAAAAALGMPCRPARLLPPPADGSSLLCSTVNLQAKCTVIPSAAALVIKALKEPVRDRKKVGLTVLLTLCACWARCDRVALPAGRGGQEQLRGLRSRGGMVPGWLWRRLVP